MKELDGTQTSRQPQLLNSYNISPGDLTRVRYDWVVLVSKLMLKEAGYEPDSTFDHFYHGSRLVNWAVLDLDRQ